MTADRHYADCAARCDKVAAQNEGRVITEGDEEATDKASEVYYRAREALFTAQPKTILGLRAIFESLSVDCYLSQDELEQLVETILSSPALTV